MSIENSKQGISIANVEGVYGGILHGFSPACVGVDVPCISAEMKEMELLCPSTMCLSLLGSDKYTPM